MVRYTIKAESYFGNGPKRGVTLTLEVEDERSIDGVFLGRVRDQLEERYSFDPWDITVTREELP